MHLDCQTHNWLNNFKKNLNVLLKSTAEVTTQTNQPVLENFYYDYQA